MTKSKMHRQFIKLLSIHGVSGDEGAVRGYLIPCLTSTMDTVEVDHYGNLLAEKTFGTGDGATVLLSAHMDTVQGVLEDRQLIEENGYIMSDIGALGADDRAGIAIILDVIRHLNKQSSFNGKVKVAFSREEEIGCVGSSQIDYDFYQDVDLAIVVDRKGTRDIVTGCSTAFCSNEVGIFMENVGKLIEQEDWMCVEGGISDAMTFSMGGINSINLSAGYRNEHTSNEFVSLEAMNDTATLIKKAFEVINDFYGDFTAVPSYNKWVKSYASKYSKYSNSYYNDARYFDDEYYYNTQGSETDMYSVTDGMKPTYTSPDGETELYYLSHNQYLLKQGYNEIILSDDDLVWFVSSILKEQGTLT